MKFHFSSHSMFWKCSQLFLAFAASCLGSNDVGQAEQAYLSVVPILSSATLDYGRGKIPFVITNNSTSNVAVETYVKLLTLNDTGKRVSIDEYMNGQMPPGWGPEPLAIVLKPSESGTFNGSYKMETLTFLEKNGKDFFGRVMGHVVNTGEKFECYSDPFPVPTKLAEVPWTDIGEQSYFSVTPDLSKSLLSGPNITDRRIIRKAEYAELLKNGTAESILFPVVIANKTSRDYIAATDSVTFYIVRNGSKKKVPSPWDTIKCSKPILKPGESAASTGRCYISIEALESEGYKAGDELVAAVGGRIPNTNQIFECYSAPFELPPLPASHPPK